MMGCVVADKLLYGYRDRCDGHRYRVDEGADPKELGAVGRVFRNKCPESSPDLRLYSTHEFPFRDIADACGLRSLCALPVFDPEMKTFRGIMEVLYAHENYDMLPAMWTSLEGADFTTTHPKFGGSDKEVDYDEKEEDNEVFEMLRLATRVMPQLQTAHVWIPCHQCPNDTSCMEIADYIIADGKPWDFFFVIDDDDVRRYYEACELHHLRIGGHKPCICPNVCDLSISENPLAHFAQKAKQSLCFTVRLQGLRDFKVVEFFLHCDRAEDEFTKSCRPLLLEIMKMKLKNHTFAYEGEGLEVAASEEESTHLSMLMAIDGWNEIYQASDFINHFEKVDLLHSEPSQMWQGWVFWSHENAKIYEVQRRIKGLMEKLASLNKLSYGLAQFWAPKLDGESCYLEAAGQPFFLDQLYKGLAYFRKQSMEHRYYVDKDGASKEDQLGPPGRVFLNKHPEITPDLRLYSPKEFPLRDHAVRCGLKSYSAIPIFKKNQHKCVGVLELVCDSEHSLIVVGRELRAANLMSTHVDLHRCFLTRPPPDKDGEGWNLALTEINQACEQFASIPQLYMVEVWECPDNKKTKFCMERIWPSADMENTWDLPWHQVQKVELGKGIAGMALQSQSKSCFCRNLCGFSIVEQPLAHYAWRHWLDVCFAICVQSRHTGDLVYILEFYLIGTRHTYKYFQSFLCTLLEEMMLKLPSFKVASGKKLGENLVVEAMEFSQENELKFSESDQPDDGLPVTFKLVNYCVRTTATRANLKGKKAVDEVGTKRKARPKLTIADVTPHFDKKLADVANELGWHESTIRCVCKRNKICKWPADLKKKKTAEEVKVEGTKRELMIDNLIGPTSDMTNPHSRGLGGPVVEPDVGFIVMAKYEDDILKMKLSRLARLENLFHEIGRRLDLSAGSFKLKYRDDEKDVWVLLACDDDLQLCLETAIDTLDIQVVRKATPLTPFMFISSIRDYVMGTTNVKGDGHYGYRAVAQVMGFGEGAWARVRRELIHELKMHKDLYAKAFIQNGACDEILKALNCFHLGLY